MVQYTLTPRMLETVKEVASDPLELTTGYRAWFPTEPIPAAVKSYWYYLAKVQEPAISGDGKAWTGVRTARIEGSNPIVWMRYGFEWDFTEIDAARRQNVPLKADDSRMAKYNLENKIAQMIIEGLDIPQPISGITETGTDLGATLDAVMVATADQLYIHGTTIKNHFVTSGVKGPFNWIWGTKIDTYADLLLANGGGPQRAAINNLGLNTFIEREIVDTSFSVQEENQDIYPMVYNTDDSIWVACSADPSYHALQEIFAPRVRLATAMDESDMVWRGWVEWAGTLRTTHAAAACFMEDVDFA